MTSAVTFGPVINQSLVYGVSSGDHNLRAFNSADGSSAFTYNSGAANSQVVLGSDGTIYFTDGKNELNAIVRSSATATLAGTWSAPFNGKNITSFPAITITGNPAEPTLASDGTLYFGTDTAVYAIITDSFTGQVSLSAGSNWPRVGFDNCNQNNSAATNCQ